MKYLVADSNPIALFRPLTLPHSPVGEAKRRQAFRALRLGYSVVALSCLVALSGCGTVPSGGASPPNACIAWGCS